jgi:methyl-accepting chemotaxis protein
MLIQFTLQDLLLFLGSALLGIIGVLLILILWKANKVMGTFRIMIDSNQELIKRSLKTLPEIMENTEQISSNIKGTTDKLNEAFPGMLKDTEYITHETKNAVEAASTAVMNVSTGVNDTVDAIKQDASDFGTYFHIVTEIIKIIFRSFSSGK